MTTRLITIIIAFSLFIFGLASPTSALTSSLSISPPVIEILLAPNKKVVHAFELINQGESGDFVANLHPLIPTDDMGHSTIDPDPVDLASIPIIPTLANSDRELGTPFSLAAGESTQLVLELESASTDSTSDTYLALVVKPSTPPSATSTTTPGISALILTTLTPDGTLPVNIELVDFDPPLVHDNLSPLKISAALQNSAPVMLRTEGKLEIISPRNHTVIELPLYPNLILRTSKRIIQGITEDEPPIATPLTWQPTLRNLGPYRLRMIVTTLGGSQITTVEKTVWLLPIRATIIFTLIAIVVIYLLTSLKRRQTPPTQPLTDRSSS